MLFVNMTLEGETPPAVITMFVFAPESEKVTAELLV